MMKKLLIYFVKGYQRFLSPLLGRNCIYTPTCSTYMIEAIEKRGVFIGTLKGLYRILRCNPFSKGGFDPVNDNLKGKAKWLI